MNVVWFVLGILTSFVIEMIACIVYAVTEVNKRGGEK